LGGEAGGGAVRGCRLILKNPSKKWHKKSGDTMVSCRRFF